VFNCQARKEREIKTCELKLEVLQRWYDKYVEFKQEKCQADNKARAALAQNKYPWSQLNAIKARQ